MSEENTEAVPYHYIAVRKDLPIEKQLVHVGHAADESVRPELCPLPDSTRIVLFHADSQEQLVEYAAKIQKAGFRVALIHEPEGPEYGRGYVSLGVEPSLRRNKLRKLFHHLPLASFDK